MLIELVTWLFLGVLCTTVGEPTNHIVYIANSDDEVIH